MAGNCDFVNKRFLKHFRFMVWRANTINGISAAALFFLCLQWTTFAHAAGASPSGQADWCKRLVPRLPGVSSVACRNSALAPTGATSKNGFPILAREVLPVENSADDPEKDAIRILLLGGIH